MQDTPMRNDTAKQDYRAGFARVCGLRSKPDSKAGDLLIDNSCVRLYSVSAPHISVRKVHCPLSGQVYILPRGIAARQMHSVHYYAPNANGTEKDCNRDFSASGENGGGYLLNTFQQISASVFS